jgi:sugar lactone lactonase YvrE
MQFQHNCLKKTLTLVAVSLACLLINACGGGGSAPTVPFTVPVSTSEPTPTPIPIPTPPSSAAVPTAALFAGHLSGRGFVDGIGAAARFSEPRYLATDSAGNVYVAGGASTRRDTTLGAVFVIGGTTIRKITPGGVVTTLAGKAGVLGSADGIGASASFSYVTGIAIDSADNLYVMDGLGSGAIRKITPAGLVSTLVVTASVPASGGGGVAALSFGSVGSITVDGTGNLYVTNMEAHTVVKIASTGVVTALAGTGQPCTGGGSVSTATFCFPSGVAVDGAGNLYVAESGNGTIRKITPAGVVSNFAGNGNYGNSDGTGAAATFTAPNGIAIDSAGNFYVADTGNQKVRKITPAGLVSTLAGDRVVGSADGVAAAATFRNPQGIATDRQGNVYVADKDNHAIRKITPTGAVTTLAGMADVMGSADGSGAAAGFSAPESIAADSSGNFYLTDTFNHTIRKITPTGLVSTLAGKAGVNGSADGSVAAATFGYPRGIAIDSLGNLYVADTGNGTVRKITPVGLVSTLAGTAGVAGSADGSGAAASFRYPTGIVTDGTGNLFVTDPGQNTIRKITPAGLVSTLAGSPGVYGGVDGNGAVARFNSPTGIAIDSAGNLYVTDTGNATIRKITPGGAVNTLAGRPGVYGIDDGSGAAVAKFLKPTSLAIDSASNLYTADEGVIRKITPAGLVTTLVGLPGGIGVNAGALPDKLSPALGLAISGTSLYVTMENGIAVVTNLP